MNKPLPNLMIRASAGTGKTYQLTNRYLSLLADNQPPERILASTFTRKAAGEILDRIVERLAQAAVHVDACDQLSRSLERTTPLTQEHVQQMLLALLANLHRVRISTLDAFFARLARTFCLELGLPPSWSVVDELTDKGIKDDAIQAMLTEDGADALLHLLAKGEAQRGISQLVRDAVNQLHGIYRSTEASAWQVVKRKELPRDSAIEDSLAKIEGYAFEKDLLTGAASQDIERFRARDWGTFLVKGIANAVANGKSRYSRVPIPDSVIPAYQTLVQSAAGMLINQLVSHTEGTFRVLHDFDLHYEQLKRQYGAFRFDDVTFSVAKALANQPSELFTFRNDDQIDHLLLDEFQDTAPSQWSVIRQFAERTVEGKAGRSFFCVGDVKQAIYGWRGGEAEIFETVTSQLDGIKVAPSLNHSRRSSPVVIRAVNQIFSNLTKHDNLGGLEQPVRRWCDGFERHTAESKAAGYVRLESADSSDALVERAVERVIELHRADPTVTIGVLTRKNTTVNEVIFRLGQEGIAASEEGGNPLTDSAAVNLLMSMLTWIDHPGDTAALFHVATSPLGRFLRLPSPYSELLQFSTSKQASKLADRWRRKLLVEGYDSVVEAWGETLLAHCTPREALRLNQLLDLAATWNVRKTLRVTDFVRFVETQRVAEPSAAAVRVMTVHQAKGLEFDAVVLPELNIQLVGQTPPVVVHHPDPGEAPDGVIRYANQALQHWLPKPVQGWFEQYEARSVSESLCVLYVAITRARNALYMIIPPNEKEQKLPRRYDGLLRGALCDGAKAGPNMLLHQDGNPRWYLERQQATLLSADNDPPDEALSSNRWREAFPLQPPTVAKPSEVVSPSSLEGGNEVTLAHALNPTNNKALQFGSLIHKWFEQIHWIDDYELDTGQLRDSAGELEPSLMPLDDSEALLDSAIAYFSECIQRDEIRIALDKSSSYATAAELGVAESQELDVVVSNEINFAVSLEGRLMQGTIDRLVEFQLAGRTVAAEVIDFKTDRVMSTEGREMASRVAFYRPQMEAYCQAVCEMTSIPSNSVRARLLFVDPKSPHSFVIKPT